jgi:hypothetical protein
MTKKDNHRYMLEWDEQLGTYRFIDLTLRGYTFGCLFLGAICLWIILIVSLVYCVLHLL